MKDGGAWNDLEKKWYNGEGLFNWNRIHKLAFDFIDGLTEECCIRNIVVK